MDEESRLSRYDNPASIAAREWEWKRNEAAAIAADLRREDRIIRLGAAGTGWPSFRCRPA